VIRGRPIPNTFAYVALLGWPIVCIGLFVLLPVEIAAIWSLLAGYLLLPSGVQIDLPMLPPLDKMSIPAVATVLLCWAKGARSKPPKHSWVIYLLSFVFIISPIFTSFNNSYELPIAKGSIPGFYPFDGLKLAGRNLILLGPFYVGKHYLGTDEARASLLKALPAAALFYSLPMLVEIRLSPQLHRWVYGFFPHQFAQQYRNGGFRPVVFLDHGLQVALFASLAVIASLVIVRLRGRIMQIPAPAVAAYLGVMLVLCKTLGALIYAVVLAPLILFTRPRVWTKIACVILLVVCAYPALRWHGLIPVEQISRAAGGISADRSSSFDTRVENEGQLLAKAQEKPLFGWGTWGRNRIYDSYGKDISITDGEWIIEFGTFGWLGYLSLFGLFAAAGFRASRAIGSRTDTGAIVIGGLSLLLAINVIDLLPNSNLTPLTFLLAGSIASASRVRVAKRRPIRSGRPVRSSVAVPAQ
jgi:hypothetical protein